MKLGISLTALEMPIRRGLAEARRLGVSGVRLDAIGDLSPNRLSDTGRRELRQLLRSHGLELTAIGCPLRHGLDEPVDLQPRIDRIRKVMELSFELGPRIVIVQAGQIPSDQTSASFATLRESLLALGQHGDRIGSTLALDTGMESAEVMATFLSQFDTGAIGVNYDPANMLMSGFDPVANLQPLKSLIVHTTASDARKRSANRAAAEVSFGHGDIDWMLYLATLSAMEYRGWLVVNRALGSDRLADVSHAVTFLRRFL